MADATVLITLVLREVMNLRHDQINPIVQAFALGRPTAMTVSLGLRMDDKYETKSVKIAEKKNTELKQASLDEFTLFPKLPIEIRNRIWKLAIEPRIISFKDIGRGLFNMVATLHTPTIFHISKESREVARSIYRKGNITCPGDQRSNFKVPKKYRGKLYYSPEHDILLGCVDGSEWEKIRLAVVPLKHRFQHIAIGAETLEAIVEHKPGLYGDLRKLAGLKKITLIWNHQKQTQEGGHMKFVKDEDAERKANTGKVTKLTKMLEEQREGWNKPKVNVAHIEFN